MKRLALACTLFTGATLSAQTNTFPSSGNVGIGTAAPEAPLDVNGAVIARGLYSFIAKAPLGYWGFNHENFFAGRAGDVYGRGFSSQALGIFNGSTTAEDIFLFNRNNPDGGVLVLKASGNVGIGTTNPQSSLHLFKQNTVSRTSVQDLVYLSTTHADVSYNGAGTGIVDFRRTYRNGTPHVINRISMIERGDSLNDFGGAITFETKSLNSGFEVPVERMRIDHTGNVGIGTTNPTHKLAVNGTIKAKEIIVEITGWSDYVFADDYALQPLAEVEAHIKANKHLPGIPSAAEVATDGISLGDMQAKLLAKIEELTLHQIAQQKLLNRQETLLETQSATLATQSQELASLRSEVRTLRDSAKL